MIPLLTSIVGRWIGGLVALIVVGGSLYAAHAVQVSRLERQVLNLQSQLAVSQGQTAAARADLAAVTANRDILAAQLKAQTAAVEALQRSAQQATAQADLSATETLLQGEQSRREIESAPGSGPGEMNTWLQAAFSPSQ